MEKPVIVIVEDNVDLLNILKAYIEDVMPCRIITFKDCGGTRGGVIWEMHQMPRVDVVISDVDFGKRALGPELIRMIRSNEDFPFPTPKTILISGRRDEHELESHAQIVGADAYFAKPFLPSSLAKKVKELTSTPQLVA